MVKHKNLKELFEDLADTILPGWIKTSIEPCYICDHKHCDLCSRCGQVCSFVNDLIVLSKSNKKAKTKLDLYKSQFKSKKLVKKNKQKTE